MSRWSKGTKGNERSGPPLWLRLLLWPFFLSRWLSRCGGNAFSRLVIGLGAFAFFCGVAVFIPLAVFYGVLAVQYDLSEVEQMPERSLVVDVRGREVMRLHGENRLIVSYDEVAPVFVDALVAREDERFFRHGGVDLAGILRATLRNLKDREFTQGGSTLTMQLARNSFELGGDTLHRKLLEIAVTLRIEKRYSKEEILEHYMNRIFWGHHIRGIEKASRGYFGKPASELTLSEAAMLAGIIRGPNAFSPFKSMEKARRERDTTLDRMVDAGKISAELAEMTKARELVVDPGGGGRKTDSAAEAALRRELELILERENIKLGGLQIRTSIDLELQKSAEAALEQQLAGLERQKGYRHQTRAEFKALRSKRPDAAPEYVQGAVVVLDNDTGAIRAIVGARDADDSEWDRARKARRSVGSLFKPFVYATAFNKGLLPGSFVSDGRLSRSEYPDLPRNWSPANSDGKYGGLIPAHRALVRSRNTPAVRVGVYSGLDRIRAMAGDAGFLGEIPDHYASFLGSFDATPLEVATAYTTFPNGGKRPRPYLIEEIRDRDNQVLYRSGVLSVPVYSAGATWVTTQILQGVTKPGGTAGATRRLGFTKPCGGKTGTTKNYTNAWFAGFTSELTAVVWVGMDAQSKSIAPGAYGSAVALPIWAKVMGRAGQLGYPAGRIDAEIELEKCTVCRYSAKLATSGCQAQGAAYKTELPRGLVPQVVCPQHAGSRLDRGPVKGPRQAVPAR